MGITTDTIGHSQRRIGLIGGTFDPIHLGHLLAAEQCREQLQLDEVRFIVAAHSPFKLQQRSADDKYRLEMVELAIGGNSAFKADPRELRRGGTSYTVDTLKEIQAELADAQLVFLMGADSLVDFDKWREPEEICRLAFIAVVARGGYAPPDLQLLAKYLPKPGSDLSRHLISMPVCEISSSNIRECVAVSRSIRYQVPAAVAAYIQQHQLYR
jgi:nicotinate-nucleotide adenylyltransferase